MAGGKKIGSVWRGEILASIVLFGVSLAAHADCDDVVKSLRTRHLGAVTLCEVQSRYRAAAEKLRPRGITDATHLGNVYALRFIDKKSWAQYLNKNGDTPDAAWAVYAPRNTAWGNWARAALHVDNADLKDFFGHGAINTIEAWLLSLHKIAMAQLLPPNQTGVFRSEDEIIPLRTFAEAYTNEEISSVIKTKYRSSVTGLGLMTFSPRLCDGQTSVEQLLGKSCGDLTMAPTSEVAQNMAAWAAYLQRGFKRLEDDPTSVDILAFAARVQQRLSIIHPFVDGNGRISRLMMDAVFSQFGLPAPLLTDMNQDFFTTPQQWADQIGEGLVHSVEALEACARTLSPAGCKVVSKIAPGRPEKI